MYEVHIYTEVSGRCPREQERSGFYSIKTKTRKGMAKLENTVKVTATKNMAELLVLNEALSRIFKECELVIHTNSRYVAAAFQQGWIEQWEKAMWKTSKGKPVENREEWQKTLNFLYGKPFRVVLNENCEKNEGENVGKP